MTFVSHFLHGGALHRQQVLSYYMNRFFQNIPCDALHHFKVYSDALYQLVDSGLHQVFMRMHSSRSTLFIAYFDSPLLAHPEDQVVMES